MTASSPSTDSEGPVLDLEGTLRRLGNDRQLFVDLVRFYREDSPGLVNNLRDAIERRDAPAATLAAHSLKGLSATCGGVSVAKIAAHLEERANREDFSALAAALPELDAAMSRLNDALEHTQPRD